jgi:hypothetical protein
MKKVSGNAENQDENSTYQNQVEQDCTPLGMNKIRMNTNISPNFANSTVAPRVYHLPKWIVGIWEIEGCLTALGNARLLYARGFQYYCFIKCGAGNLARSRL